MTRAAIYCRVSTDTQEKEGSSLRTQLEACRTYAEAKGYDVLPEYEYQEVYTGTALWERSKLSALREAIRAKAVDVVVCYAIDRLSRDATHLGVILSEADHKRVAVEFVSEPLDDSPEGQLIRFVRGYAAKIEHGKTKDRSRRGREARAKSGKPIPGGSAPLGYRWVWESASQNGNGHKSTVVGYEIDPDTAPLVRRIFEHLAEGGSVSGLAASLNTEGVPTSKGGRLWYHKTLCVIVANPIYRGEAQSLKARYELVNGQRTKPQSRPDDERVRIPTPVLVSPELWKRANDQIGMNRTESKRNNRNPGAYLLRSGFIRCGYCGAPIMAAMHTGSPKYRCSSNNKWLHGCPGGGTMLAADLDKAVWDMVAPVIGNPEILLEEIDRELATPDTTENDLATLDSEIVRLTRQQGMLANSIARLDTVEAAEPLFTKLDAVARQKLDLLAERKTLESRRDELVDAERLLGQMYTRLHDESERLENLSYAERRRTLRSLGVQVRLWKMNHEPRFQVDMAIDPTAYVFRPEDDEDLPGPEIWHDTIQDTDRLGAFGRFVDTTSTCSTEPCTTSARPRGPPSATPAGPSPVPHWRSRFSRWSRRSSASGAVHNRVTSVRSVWLHDDLPPRRVFHRPDVDRDPQRIEQLPPLFVGEGLDVGGDTMPPCQEACQSSLALLVIMALGYARCPFCLVLFCQVRE